MSLLLKALQKSQAEQNQQAFSAAGTLHHNGGYGGAAHSAAYQNSPSQPGGNTIINTGNTHNTLFAIVIGCNLLLIVAASYFWLQGQSNSSNDTTENLLIQALTRVLENANANQVASTEVAEQSLAQALADQADKVESTLLATLPADETRSNVSRNTQIEPLTSLQPTAEETTSNNKLTQNMDTDRLYNKNELPDEVFADFPILNYNAHLYSPDVPSARMIMANNIRYTENDRIDQNTRVETIVPDGVIFNFNGLRIKVDVVNKLQ